MNESFDESLQKEPNFKSHEEEVNFLRSKLEQFSKSDGNIVSSDDKKEKVAEKIVEQYKEAPI